MTHTHAGQMRMTVSLCVVLLEMCNSQATLPFLMVVIIVAKGAADRLGDPLVVRRIKLKGLPFIARMPHLSQRRGRLSAATIVRKSDFPLLPPCAPATRAPRVLCMLRRIVRLDCCIWYKL